MNINIVDQLVKADTPINLPKMTSGELKIKNNYYVVTDGDYFNYYPIKVEESNEDQPFLRFEKAPPVILEGFAIVDKKLYKVPVQDLMRRIVRKSREVTLEVLNGTDTNTAATSSNQLPGRDIDSTSTGTTASEAISNLNQRGAVREIEVEISQAADIAWKNEIRALLSVISEKEGSEGEDWEIADFT